ncbi:hypothetical protein WJX72_005264 [[Myrmecia] bisecta]|uniref:Amino acid transporter transmembrane domain-containing protein n=1 Tax=[Myrmecia] bisecta TaxID=41462 RepID=A0AAW1Q7V8_9CHLO
MPGDDATGVAGGAKKPLHQTAKALLTEGHTALDAFLSCASAQVGQVILTYPYNLALVGILPGIALAVVWGLLNFYTLWLLIIIFLERKQRLIKKGEWYQGVDKQGYAVRKEITQYHDLITYTLGRWLGYFAQLVTAVFIFGVGIAQVVASASSQYAISPGNSKRTWALILGGFVVAPSLLPGFRDVRLLNLIALIGTNYSCLYFFVYAASHGIVSSAWTRGPQSLKAFFLGAAIVGTGSHSIQVEMMDAMRKPRKFTRAAFTAWVWNLVLLIPHSTAIILAFPNKALTQANVYSILPNSGWKTASVWLMLIHNIGAFTLHTNPLCYMWEKLIGTHHSSLWIKLPSRIPVLLAIWLVALALPFYGTMNSLFNAFTTGFNAFVLPCLAFNIHFRKAERREACPIQPPGILAARGWKPIFCLNWFLIVFMLVFPVGFGAWASVSTLIANIKTFHWFAACYQCPVKKVASPPVHHFAPAPAPFSNGTYIG